MLQDWSFIKPYFASTSFFKADESDILLFIVYILFCVCVTVSILKLIYDINLKFQVAIHILSMINEIINLAIMVFLTL